MFNGVGGCCCPTPAPVYPVVPRYNPGVGIISIAVLILIALGVIF